MAHEWGLTSVCCLGRAGRSPARGSDCEAIRNSSL